MTWFAVQGRVPGTDDDSLMSFQAETREEAEAAFIDVMNDGVPAELVAERSRRFGCDHGVYIVNVAESDSEIRVL